MHLINHEPNQESHKCQSKNKKISWFNQLKERSWFKYPKRGKQVMKTIEYYNSTPRHQINDLNIDEISYQLYLNE